VGRAFAFLDCESNRSALTICAFFDSRIAVMDWKVFLTIFAAVFVAELGDKTQLATVLFAADKEVNKIVVFVAASAALIVASGLGVLVGSLISASINEQYLNYMAGVGFIVIGVFTLYHA
jgi:putative Ca2+/H+ antiporter (TMEM165/GDT1 family)